ncbi:MAG: hypothetical protein ACREDK_08770 [Thermoplasmata archaeon]
MDEPRDPRSTGARREEPPPLDAVVPARAVLTELARGFLLVHQSDRAHATRFALTFLREQAGPPPSRRVISPAQLAHVRHGVATALRDPRAP